MGSVLIHFARLITVSVLGLAILIFGIVWLIEGISDHKTIPMLAGGLALATLITAFFYTLARSKRQVSAAAAITEEKVRAGIRTCGRCTTEFEEAAAPTTPKPWYLTALGVAVAALLMGAAGIGLWAVGFTSQLSVKLYFFLLFGIALLIQSVKGASRLQLHCPACNRVCGTVAGKSRGFPIKTS